ncbi:fibronectin type III domain-containing protein 5 [Lampris incognitus]|uniref:fibronectin type III domain-containing protein 5 n=1 Tax=Lampris incognitus TaxID=2546036 RepID=UPI0024B4FABB|nr:fibronectin type III domain-containing protein 5 [Lampris incognitus]
MGKQQGGFASILNKDRRSLPPQSVQRQRTPGIYTESSNDPKRSCITSFAIYGPLKLAFFPAFIAFSMMGHNSLVAPVNVTIRALKANSAVVTWDIPEGDTVIGFAITQQKKDVRMLRFIQEVNTTTRSCALWDLDEETDYIVHVQSISMSGPSQLSEPLRFRTPKEAETQASKSKDEVTMEEVGQTTQLRAGELIIIVVVLIMWAGVIALFCRQYDIIKDNEPNNNKDKAKNSSECSTPEHPTGGLLRSKFPKNNNNNNRTPSVNIIEV